MVPGDLSLWGFFPSPANHCHPALVCGAPHEAALTGSWKVTLRMGLAGAALLASGRGHSGRGARKGPWARVRPDPRPPCPAVRARRQPGAGPGAPHSSRRPAAWQPQNTCSAESEMTHSERQARAGGGGGRSHEAGFDLVSSFQESRPPLTGGAFQALLTMEITSFPFLFWAGGPGGPGGRRGRQQTG